jgi:hypothetical protein
MGVFLLVSIWVAAWDMPLSRIRQIVYHISENFSIPSCVFFVNLLSGPNPAENAKKRPALLGAGRQ